MNRAKQIAFWVVTILGPSSFIIGGVGFLTGTMQEPIQQMMHLGYPLYLLKIIGFWKILGAIVITLPRLPLLKEWAYAGFFLDLSGAAASHVLVGDPSFSSGPAMFGPALIFLCLVTASWILRPPSRRLPGTDVFHIWSA